MIDLLPAFDYVKKPIQEVAEDCGITCERAADILMWGKRPNLPFDTVMLVVARYNIPVKDAFDWIPDKGAKMMYGKWKKKMAGRWDRYRRQRILEELTDTRQNWSLSFKLDVINEYYSTDITMRELSEKYDVPRAKIKGWIFKNHQV